MAMASENSDLSQWNSSAIGIWNTPNEERTAKLSRMMRLPVISTGVKSEAERVMMAVLMGFAHNPGFCNATSIHLL